MGSLFLVCCAEAVQLAASCLSGEIFLTMGVCLMRSWEGTSSVFSNVTILDLLPIIFNKILSVRSIKKNRRSL